MVTIAQGKFSKPRHNMHADDTMIIPQASPKTAADPIEKAEAEVARFVDSAMQENASTPLDATVVAPEGWTEGMQNTEIDASLTQVIPETVLASQEAPVVTNQTISGTPILPEEEEDEDEEYAEEPGFFATYRKPILVGGCAAVLILLGLIIGMVVSMNNKEVDNGKILKNVIVAGVDVGGMTPEKAKIAVYNATANTYDTQTMTVTLPDNILHFKPEDTGVTLNVDAAVEAAYNFGRVGTKEEIERAKAQVLLGNYELDLLPFLELDAEYIHETLEQYSTGFNSSYLSSSYTFEGDMPGLTAETFDETVPCQTLVLQIGNPGRNLDIQAIYTDVLMAYCQRNFQVDASEAPEQMPELPDLKAIFDEYCSTPVDAYMDMQTFAVTGEVYGYTFDLEEAQRLLEDAVYGSTIRIGMEYLIPEVRTADLVNALYADVLGSCQTPHTSNSNRNNNLRLACQAINGLVLEPGQEFSFNEIVGERTAERGYRAAPAYANGETVSELGGGVCQISSTLYYCVLLADLEVTERQNHSYVSTYIDRGMDATVSWGGPDFKFRNSSSYPIRIEAEVADGNVKIQLLGTDEKDYYIKMEYDIAGYLAEETEYKEFDYDNAEGYADGDVIQEGVNGEVVDTYKHKYDKETGEAISEEYVTRSYYRPKNEIIAKVAPKPTQPPTEPPTTAPTTPPTQAPTEAPTQATTPPATEPVTPVTEPVTSATEPAAPVTEPATSTETAVSE